MACDGHSNEHEDGSSGGPEDKLLDRQRRHTPPERHFTCHLLFLRLDTSPDSQSWRPPWKSTKTTAYERLDLKGAIHWVVNLIFITTETHDNAHALTTSIQQLILPIFTISNLRLKLNTILTMHRHPPCAFYTHYYNIYSLKTSASNVIPM